MSSLLAALAFPAAKSAIESARSVAASAERSFADALRTAAEFCHPQSEVAGDALDADGAERDALGDQIASQLQGLCDAAGARPGESFHITVDEHGVATVDGNSPARDAIQEALVADPNLVAELIDLAQRDDRFADGTTSAVLKIDIAQDGGASSMAWQ